MNFSNFTNITTKLIEKFDDTIFVQLNPEAIQPYAQIKPESLISICQFLHEDPEFYFDFLNCITAIDNGLEKGTLELWYHLSSIPTEQSFIIKLELPRGDENNLPEIDSISSIWQTADWHEREAFDLVGVKFNNHPDLRRILLPADWKGHPLRKDYQDQEKYHGIKIKY